MVEWIVTKDVNRHKKNPSYNTVVGVWRLGATACDNFQSWRGQWTWCPRDEEVAQLVDLMLTHSPTFKAKILEVVEKHTATCRPLVYLHEFLEVS
jgi:hypothetical protein